MHALENTHKKTIAFLYPRFQISHFSQHHILVGKTRDLKALIQQSKPLLKEKKTHPPPQPLLHTI
jgi:hypothetical protein